MKKLVSQFKIMQRLSTSAVALYEPSDYDEPSKHIYLVKDDSSEWPGLWDSCKISPLESDRYKMLGYFNIINDGF